MANTSPPAESGRVASSVAGEIRRQRKAIGLSLQALSGRTGLSVGYLSRVERGERQPSLPGVMVIREALGLGWSLPEEVVSPGIRDLVDGDVIARLGAIMSAYHELELGQLADLLGMSVGGVRAGLRRLSSELSPLGMAIFDDGAKARLAPEPTMTEMVAKMIGTSEVTIGRAQMEILAIVIWHGQVTRRRIEEIRGVSSVESLSWLVEHGLLARDRDDETPGRANVYRVTSHALQLLGATSREEVCGRLQETLGTLQVGRFVAGKGGRLSGFRG